MPKINVNKSIKIDAPVEKVFSTVREFKQWQPWSPWLIADPEALVTYQDDGMKYSWEGQVTGSGQMEILGEEANESIDYNLTFLKPWKSVAGVRFEFAAVEGGTEVTWSMDSSLPFFMFFFRGMMEAFIGMDYQRGLTMLKDYVEKGRVDSLLAFPGVGEFPGCHFVGLRRLTSMEEMGAAMGKDFSKLKSWLADSGTATSGEPFSIYHMWDPVKKRVEYTCGFPVEGEPADLPDGFCSGSIPACSTYRVVHTGPYHFLSNAWSAGHMHARSKQFKLSKKIDGFEIYGNDSAEVDDEKDLLTTLHFPVKA